MKVFALLALFCLSQIAAAQPSPVPLAPGEALKYRVHWGIFPNAGEISISAAAEEMVGLPEVRITTHTNTRGLVRSLYLFDGDGESVFDQRDGRPLVISTWSTSTNKMTKTMAVFDYPASIVKYVDYIRPERSQNIALPDGNAMDLITCLIATRNWDMKPGQRTPATVMFDKDFYDLVIVAEGIEKVHTGMGDFEALVLHPTMEKNPRGLFKRGGTVRVWIAQDDRHLPVQFEVGMKFGTGVATLSSYTPPKSPAPVAVDENSHP